MWLFDDVDKVWEFVPTCADEFRYTRQFRGTWYVNRMNWQAFRPEVTTWSPS